MVAGYDAIRRGEIWWAELPESRGSGPGGNVLLSARASGLALDSVVNVTQLAAIDRTLLTKLVSKLSPKLQELVDAGLRRVLAL